MLGGLRWSHARRSRRSCCSTQGPASTRQSSVANIAGPVAILTSVCVGLVDCTPSCPSNPIGWLLLGNGLIFGAAGRTSRRLRGDTPSSIRAPSQAGRLAAVWDTAAWPLLFAGVVAIAFIFPDGRLLSPRWRSIAIGGAVAAAVTLVGGLPRANTLDPPFEDVAPARGAARLDHGGGDAGPRTAGDVRRPDRRGGGGCVAVPAGPKASCRAGIEVGCLRGDSDPGDDSESGLSDRAAREVGDAASHKSWR